MHHPRQRQLNLPASPSGRRLNNSLLSSSKSTARLSSVALSTKLSTTVSSAMNATHKRSLLPFLLYPSFNRLSFDFDLPFSTCPFPTPRHISPPTAKRLIARTTSTPPPRSPPSPSQIKPSPQHKRRRFSTTSRTALCRLFPGRVVVLLILHPPPHLFFWSATEHFFRFWRDTMLLTEVNPGSGVGGQSRV